MLTDQLLNITCMVAISDHKLLSSSVAKDCYSILKFYDQTSDDIPIAFKMKLQMAQTLCKLRATNIHPEIVLDQVRQAGKYVELDSFLVKMADKGSKLDDATIEKAIKQIQTTKILSSSLGDFSKLKEFVEMFDTNGFESVDEAILAYEKMVESLYGHHSTHKRDKLTSKVQSLDLFEGDYEPAMDMISQNNSGKNVVPTGYAELDKYLKKGFQPGRLYIFAGTSNDGKSTLLMNFLNNQVEQNKTVDDDKNDLDIYLYVTLENLIDESLLRLYCTSEKVTFDNAIADWENVRKTLPDIMKEKQKDKKSALMMHFFPGTSISVFEIEKLIDETNERYAGRGTVKGVFVDYLDLVTSGRSFDLHRLELGQVAMDMKILAVIQQIPVITVTQLNRSAYDKDGSGLSLNMMSESIKKVEHADVVALIRALLHPSEAEQDSGGINDSYRPSTSKGEMLICIAKNRSGPKGISFKLATDFSMYSVTEFEGGSVQSMGGNYNALGSEAIHKAFEVPEADGIEIDSNLAVI